MFKERSNEIEIMDDLSCEGPVVAQTLKELDIINSWLGGNKITLNAVEKLFNEIDPQSLKSPLKIADLGCGSGDILKQIANKARSKNIPIAITGIDANPFIVSYAQNNCKTYPEIQIHQDNVLSKKFLETKFDIVNCTLFCHHFNEDDLANLLRKLYGNTSIAIIINDIHRHWFAYHSIKWLTHAFSSSEMVKNDAKLSVLRGFTFKDLSLILAKAQIPFYSIKWRWAYRYEVLIRCDKNKNNF